MKIAFIYDSAYPWFNGGAEWRRMLIAKKFINNGDEVHYFTMFRKGMPSFEFKYNNIYFHCIGNAEDETKMYINKRRNIWWAVKFAMLLIFKLNKEKFDVIDADAMPYLHLIPIAVYSKIRKVKFIISWAEIWNKKYWISYAGKSIGTIGFFIEKLCLDLTKYHIMISSKTKQEFISLNKNYKNKEIIVFPCAINSSEIEKINKKYENKCKEKRLISTNNLFLAIGRLIPEKRFDKAIESIKNTNAKLMIIGIGPEENKLKKLAEKLRISKRVIFKSRLERNELLKKIKTSLGLLMMSRREGLSIITLEVIALKKPVIVDSKTSLPDEVKKLCVISNDKSIKNLINKIIKGSINLEKHINNNSKIAIENFSDKNTLKIYNKLINS